MRRTPEAIRSPPRPPSRLSPSARKNVDTSEDHSLRGDVSFPGANSEPSIAHGHADGVPPPVPFGAARISQVVLLAQFVGDARGGRPQTFRAANHLGADT